MISDYNSIINVIEIEFTFDGCHLQVVDTMDIDQGTFILKLENLNEFRCQNEGEILLCISASQAKGQWICDLSDSTYKMEPCETSEVEMPC